MKNKANKSYLSKAIITDTFYPHSKFKSILICSDALKILRKIPNNSLDLILTSPPYNLGKEYEKDKKISMSQYFNWQEKIIKLCYKKLKPTGSICWQVGYNNHVGVGTSREYYPLEYDFHPIFSDAGFIMKNRIIWAFGLGSQNKNNFSTRHEVIMWYTKSSDYKFNLDSVRVLPKYPGKASSKKYYANGKKNLNYGKVSTNKNGKNPEDVWVDSIRSNFWEIPSVKSHHPEKYLDEDGKPIHPCQFPTALTTRLILALTDKDDLVLDPFCGLGTTGVSCALTNRKFIGIDKDKKYLDLAKVRIDEALNYNYSHIRPDKPVADNTKSALWKNFNFEKWELKKKV